MKLHVQTYLETHTAGQLREEHGVKLRWSTKRPGVFTLNYDQIDVVDADPLSQQCRGLILRAAAETTGPIGPTEIVARPFDRFFNYGAGSCAPVDFENARFYEKIDGTLCIVHFDHGSWHVGTRSVPDADVALDVADLTFRTLFERAARCPLGEGLHPDFTYMFELTAAENRVVCRYDEERVVLLGIRKTQTGEEFEPDLLSTIYPVCPHHALTLAVMLDWAADRDPIKYEGLVVCDRHFRRCKVKSPGYLALSKLRDSVGTSSRSMLELILLDRVQEVTEALPPYLLERISTMETQLAREITRIERAYEALHSPDRKTFALAIRASAHPDDMAPLMARWSGRCGDAQNWIENARKDGTWSDSFLDGLLARLGR